MRDREARRYCRRTSTINISWEKSSWKQSPCGVERSRHAACAPQESWALLTVGRQGASRWMQRPICLKHTHKAGSAEPSRPSASRGGDTIYYRIIPLYAVSETAWAKNGRMDPSQLYADVDYDQYLLFIKWSLLLHKVQKVATLWYHFLIMHPLYVYKM